MPFNCTEADHHRTAWKGNGGDRLFHAKKIEGIYLCVRNHTAVPQRGTLNDPTCLQRQ